MAKYKLPTGIVLEDLPPGLTWEQVNEEAKKRGLVGPEGFEPPKSSAEKPTAEPTAQVEETPTIQEAPVSELTKKYRLPNGNVLENMPPGLTKQEVIQSALKRGLIMSSELPEEDRPDFSWGQTAANLPSSFVKQVSDVANVISSPWETTKNISKLIRGGAINLAEMIPGVGDITMMPEAEKLAETVGTDYANKYGDWSNFKQYLQEDPLGVLSDVSTIFTGPAGIAKSLAKRVVRKTTRALDTATEMANKEAAIAAKAYDEAHANLNNARRLNYPAKDLMFYTVALGKTKRKLRKAAEDITARLNPLEEAQKRALRKEKIATTVLRGAATLDPLNLAFLPFNTMAKTIGRTNYPVGMYAKATGLPTTQARIALENDILPNRKGAEQAEAQRISLRDEITRRTNLIPPRLTYNPPEYLPISVKPDLDAPPSPNDIGKEYTVNWEPFKDLTSRNNPNRTANIAQLRSSIDERYKSLGLGSSKTPNDLNDIKNYLYSEVDPALKRASVKGKVTDEELPIPARVDKLIADNIKNILEQEDPKLKQLNKTRQEYEDIKHFLPEAGEKLKTSGPFHIPPIAAGSLTGLLTGSFGAALPTIPLSMLSNYLASPRGQSRVARYLTRKTKDPFSTFGKYQAPVTTLQQTLKEAAQAEHTKDVEERRKNARRE